MLPGDTPTFRNGFHNPTRQLNELARDVGQLLGLQARPPISVSKTPAGFLIELIDSGGSNTASRTRMARIVEPTEMHPTLPATYKAYVLRWNPTTNQLEDDFLVWLRMY